MKDWMKERMEFSKRYQENKVKEMVELLQMAHDDLDPCINGIGEAQEIILEVINKLKGEEE